MNISSEIAFYVGEVLQIVVRNEDDIASCLQLAMLLEASAYPKPGNVHRRRDFRETRFEHFLASAAALGPTYRYAAYRGIMVSKGKTGFSQVGLGKIVKTGVLNMLRCQTGGNTSLGTILLLTPIAISAGIAATNGILNSQTLRANLKRLLRSATHVDSIYLYEAISIVSPGGIGTDSELDVTSRQSIDRIKRDHIIPLKIFSIAAKRDSVASEWANTYEMTFELGYPYFSRCIATNPDINAATVNTFLKILSTVPDTLIARKVGKEKACYVSTRARKCLRAGGIATREGKRLINRLDRDLVTSNHELNPGTTADIVSAVLAIALLLGLRT